MRLFLTGKLEVMLLSQKKGEKYFTEACAVKEVTAVLQSSPEVHTNILAH